MRYRRMRVDGATYFFTVVTFERRPLFRDQATVNLLSESISSVNRRHPFELVAQVILPDHVHAIWTLPKGDANFSTRWRLIKASFTRAYAKKGGGMQPSAENRARNRHGIWQQRFWEHLIRDDREFAAHVDCIHLNPAHHQYVDAPRGWPYSTFQQWVDGGIYEAGWGSGQKPELPEWAKLHE